MFFLNEMENLIMKRQILSAAMLFNFTINQTLLLFSFLITKDVKLKILLEIARNLLLFHQFQRIVKFQFSVSIIAQLQFCAKV